MMLHACPRPEHPNPQFERASWKNLNGTWSFTFDFGQSGQHRGLHKQCGFDSQILVPFCPESVLSGVGHVDFIENMWYHRTIEIPHAWSAKRILLHFGGVDYECDIYVDGELAGSHVGGSSPFQVDLTGFVEAGGTHDLVINARDVLRSGTQTGGKQSLEYGSTGCFYTRTTGIWQTVWLEACSPRGLIDCQIIPDADGGRFFFLPRFFAEAIGTRFVVTALSGGRICGEASAPARSGIPIPLMIHDPVNWSPERPHLYEFVLEVQDRDGVVIDQVRSYSGLRSVAVEGDQLLLNGEPIYLRLVLDQGFYPDGLWTAPSEESLKRDIELSQSLGFNGARLHQKVFEKRFHYWADKLGYLTWAESPSWGMDLKNDLAVKNFLHEWSGVVRELRNHPSIIAWTPLNETWDLGNRRVHSRLHREAYYLTKELDPTRPVNGASGGCQVVTDIYTSHIYEQNPQKLRSMLAPKEDGSVYCTLGEQEAEYLGQPYIVDEFGGIKWIPREDLVYAENSWGYGETPRSLDEFYSRLQGQVDAILSLPHISGYCYTQLTDVEQEQNGLVNYDRSPKFNLQRLREIFSRSPKQPLLSPGRTGPAEDHYHHMRSHN